MTLNNFHWDWGN